MNSIHLVDTCSSLKRWCLHFSFWFLKWKKSVTFFHAIQNEPDPNFQVVCSKYNYGKGGGKLHCCSLTNLSLVNFCEANTGKTCCTTTVAKTTQLCNGWVPKPKFHLQITNKALGNHKKKQLRNCGQTLKLCLVLNRKSSFQSPPFLLLT